jgi:hypothetical protein
VIHVDEHGMTASRTKTPNTNQSTLRHYNDPLAVNFFSSAIASPLRRSPALLTAFSSSQGVSSSLHQAIHVRGRRCGLWVGAPVRVG